MTTREEMLKEVKDILKTNWSKREGRKVPEAEDVQLGNDAVYLNGTVLYADLADSTGLVNNYKDYFATEIYKAYLICCCRIISNNGGIITAFDGDRVMAVFIGDSKNTLAARCALQMKYAVNYIINPSIKEQYPNTGFRVVHGVGIDTSELFIARTGIRGSNDLVWVGRSANYAAKLCSLRNGEYSSYITEEVFSLLHDSVKYGGEPKQLMWEKIMWNDQGIAVYRSTWWWKPA